MSERGSSLGRYEPIPTIPEDGPLPPLPPPNGPRRTCVANDPRLGFKDFWPFCSNTNENFACAQFDRFDTLLPRANAWLRENLTREVIKCETVERKIWSHDQMLEDYAQSNFEVPNNIDVVYYLKGLRLWYRGPRNQRHGSAPLQIGYRNAIPKCMEGSLKTPLYEDLGPMYASLNDNLIDRPLEGPIITMETVPIRLDRLRWTGPHVEVDQTHWPMTPKQHVFFFTRVFYLFQCPAYEQVGAADFLPDNISEQTPKPGLPKYTALPFTMKKFNAWLKQVKDIRLTNIQTLEAAYPGKGEKIKTNVNFLNKTDTVHMIRFIRVTYTRPKFGLPPGGLIIPSLVSQKTFLPGVVNVNQSEGVVILEDMNVVAARIKTWLKHVGNHILSSEVLYHPLPLVTNKKDAGETSVLPGEWLPSLNETNNRKQSLQPAKQAVLVRIYLEGDYEEPTAETLASSNPTSAGGEIHGECCRVL